MSKRGVNLYLDDIINSIKKIEKYTQNVSFNEFCKDEQLMDAVIRNLSVIGEAVVNMPKEIKTKNSNMAWKEITGMRNKIIHEYFGIDEEILWITLKKDIPVFKKQIVKLLFDIK